MAPDISAGYLRTPTGEKVAQPLPFGPKAHSNPDATLQPV